MKPWIFIRNYILEDNYNQLQNAISMSILVSSLQDERYNLAFLTFSYTKGKQIKFSADVIEDFARTDTAIAGLDPWRTEIPLKDFASRVRFQVSENSVLVKIQTFCDSLLRRSELLPSINLRSSVFSDQKIGH